MASYRNFIVASRIISRNLKLGGLDKCWGVEGVNMKRKFTLKKGKNTLSLGRGVCVVSQQGRGGLSLP